MKQYRIIESPSRRLFVIQKKVETWKSWFLRICAGNNKWLSYKWVTIGKPYYDYNTALADIAYLTDKERDAKRDYAEWTVANDSQYTRPIDPPSKL